MGLGGDIIIYFIVPYIFFASLITLCIASVIIYIEDKKEESEKNYRRIRDWSIVIGVFGVICVVAGVRWGYNFFNPPLKQLLGKVVT
jgi:amino acid transporter